MFKMLKVLTVILALLASASVWGQQRPVCTVTISLEADNARSTNPIIVKAVMTNISGETITVLHEMGHQAQYEFQVAVREGNGNLAPMTEEGRLFWKGRPESGSASMDPFILPGKSAITTVNLRDLYDLKAGSYTIQLTSGNLISNIISLTVVP